jgi:hypothetical protein
MPLQILRYKIMDSSSARSKYHGNGLHIPSDGQIRVVYEHIQRSTESKAFARFEMQLVFDHFTISVVEPQVGFGRTAVRW